MIIAGVDFGDARTGLAVCDKSEIMAHDAGFVKTTSYKNAVITVGDRIKELKAELVVVGNPVNMNGSEGPRSAKCKAFAKDLSEYIGIPCELYDERLTSVYAKRILLENNTQKKKRNNKSGLIDTISATLILEDYLTQRKNKTTPPPTQENEDDEDDYEYVEVEVEVDEEGNEITLPEQENH